MRRSILPVVVGLLVIGGLLIVDVRHPLSPGTALTAQERQPSQAQIQGAQERLKAAGHDPGSVDGVWGPQTEAAVRAYQHQHGLPVSGALDEATRAALGLTTAQRPPASRPGVVPDAVQEAQTPRPVPAERPEQRLSAHDRSTRLPGEPGPARLASAAHAARPGEESWVLTSPVTRSTPRGPCSRLKRSCTRTSRPNRR